MSAEFVVKSGYKTDFRSPYRYVWSHVMRHKVTASAVIVGAFSNAALAAVLPVATGMAFTAISTPNYPDPMQQVILAVILIAGSQFLRAFLQLMRNFSTELFAQRIERDVRDEVYASLLGKSMTFHDIHPVGEIMARVTNDVREMNMMMNPGFNLVIGSGFFLIMPIVVAPTIHPALIITPLAFVILYIWSQYRFIQALSPITQQVRANFGIMNARLAESLEGLQVVKGTAQERNERAYFGKLIKNFTESYIRQSGVEARYVPNLLFGLVFAFGFLHCAILYHQGLVNNGGVVNFMGQLSLFGFPVFSSLFALSKIASGFSSAERILNIITNETELAQSTNGYTGKVKGDVTFENISFGYGNGATILKNISFTVKAGQTVAIVGQTGAGKTTLTKLINRTYDAREGRVLVDGVDVRDWSLGALRPQISVIEQDIFLFTRSIADNIAFGVDNAKREDIIEAAKKAQAHDFIMSFSDGYETVVGQRGVTLSGGQRQRLAIARAFESNPPILILDDSTSAIDSATEDRIQKAIWSASQGRTTILITHRLSQIRWADHIIVLKQGTIVAQGSHDELLKNSEAYRRIFARYESPEKSTRLSAD
jgi:ATP-binding cassette, subfamily B, bacterial